MGFIGIGILHVAASKFRGAPLSYQKERRKCNVGRRVCMAIGTTCGTGTSRQVSCTLNQPLNVNVCMYEHL